MKPGILVHEVAAKVMARAAMRCAPDETGGILVGHREDGIPVVTHAIVVPPQEPSGNRYVRRDERANEALQSYLQDREHDDPAGYIGEWHSHPGASGPSSLDTVAIRDLARTVGDAVVLIVVRPVHAPTLTGIIARPARFNRGRAFPAALAVVVAPVASPQSDDLGRLGDPSTQEATAPLKNHTTSRRALMTMPFELAGGFLAKQEHMLTGLGLMPNFTNHPTTKGDANEAQWVTVLDEFLPARYGVGPIFAIDSRGNQSDQIDLAIYDRQYSPLFFEQGGVRFVPAESVYAVFEVKPEMSKAHLEYAAEKVESVRSLFRTSAPIPHAGGMFDPQDPQAKPILGGFLSTEWSWTSSESQAGTDAIVASGLDLGIAVRSRAFDQQQTLEFAPEGEQLIWFAMRLYKRLSRLGTVLAIDLDAYYPPLTE